MASESTSTSTSSHRQYAFAGFTLDRDRGSLQRDGVDIKLRPKSYELLCYLLERHGRLVSKDEILDGIWGDTAVTDGAVVQALLDIRRAIGDRSQSMIRTVPRRGYIFDVPVEVQIDAVSGPAGGTTRGERSRWWLGAACAVLVVIAVWSWNVRNDSGEPEAERPYSIAVLPFSDMSQDQDLEYFADGISEELLNVLSRVSELRVIARTSTFAFKGKSIDIATIRERLGVTHVLEGSVRKSDDRIRITAQLIDTSTSAHVWSASYDRTLNDIFTIQDEIAEQVLTRLADSLSVPSISVRATDPRAYSLYLQGLQLANQLDEDKTLDAQQLFEQSLEIDPTYAPAWRELARVVWRGIGKGENIREDIARNADALERATELAPEEDAGLLAYLAWNEADFRGNIDKAAQLFEEAFAIDPAEENLIRVALIFTLAFGKPEDAVALGEFGVARNPLCHPCQRQLIRAYLNANRLDDAEANSRRVLSLFGMSQHVLGDTLLIQGRPQEALDAYSRDRNHSDLFVRIYSAMALHDLGRSEEATAVFDAMRDDMNGEELWRFAAAYAWMGRNDEAIETMRRAVEEFQLREGDEVLRTNLPRISMVARDPRFRRVRQDPRWTELLSQYGIAGDQLSELDFEFAVPR